MRLFIKNKILNEKDIILFEKNNNFSEYEQKTIFFCKDWLQVKNEFKLFTSGSTGKPKEITVLRSQMIFSATKTCDFLELKESSTSLISLSTEHIGGKMMLVRGLVKNFDMTIVTPSSNPLENITNSFDFLSFVPMQIYEIMKKTPKKIAILNKAKAIIIGGGEISSELEEMINIIKSPIYSTYGMTETVSHIALRRLNGVNKKDFFTVFDGVEISLDDRSCLTIKSEVTNNQLLKTNDVVELLDKQNFRWLGRYDNIINSGGIKIQIEILEKKIKEIFNNSNYNENFFITSKKDNKLGEKIVLVIEKEFLYTEDQYSFFSLLKQHLEKYEVPKIILNTKKFILTESGKLDKIATLNIIDKNYTQAEMF